MARWHLRSRKTASGGKLTAFRKKRKMDRGSPFTETKVGKRKSRLNRARGGTGKLRLYSVDKINVANPKTGKVKRTKIKSVESNPANPHYERGNIITKGAVLQTESGQVRVTSRPGQDGIANGILLEEK